MEIYKSENGIGYKYHSILHPTRDNDFLGELAYYHLDEDTLYVGEYHILNKEEVKELIKYMQNWLETGKFE
jgi:hypothetical protein